MKLIDPVVYVQDYDGVQIMKNIERACRVCYRSEGKITEDSYKSLLNNCINRGHESVLEHEKISVRIVADIGTYKDLTRHRIASFSVQSQRYVKFNKGANFIIPPTISKDKNLLAKYNEFLKLSQQYYNDFLKADIPAEDARYVLPNASTTKIILTMNARELRHFFALRCCNRAQWEIRDMACKMLKLVKEVATVLFDDAGPNCVKGACSEMKPCGSPWKK